MDSDLHIWICALFWRLCTANLGFMKIYENRSNLLNIGRICDTQLETSLLWSTIQTESVFVFHEPKQVLKSQVSWSTIQNKSMDLWYESTGTQFPDTIPAALQISEITTLLINNEKDGIIEKLGIKQKKTWVLIQPSKTQLICNFTIYS